jgi:pantoate--beta-alanine ligase
MSSRNAYLTPGQRGIAPRLHQTLRQVAGRMRDGERATAAAAWGRQRLAQSGFTEVDYLEVCTPDTLEPIEAALAPGQNARILAAAFLGKTRLIDNIAA